MSDDTQGRKKSVRQLGAGDLLDVGDIIAIDGAYGRSRLRVVRVTKKHAFVRVNDYAEQCYRRVVGSWDWPVPVPKPKWDRDIRRAYRVYE